jgi:hypothetical protein
MKLSLKKAPERLLVLGNFCLIFQSFQNTQTKEASNPKTLFPKLSEA